MVVAVVALAGVAYAMNQQQEGEDPPLEAAAATEAEAPLERENAVLVLGAGGRVGRRVVQQVRVVAENFWSCNLRGCGCHC